jgi:hypothetical protein
VSSDLDSLLRRSWRTSFLDDGVQQIPNNRLFARVVRVGSSGVVLPSGDGVTHRRFKLRLSLAGVVSGYVARHPGRTGFGELPTCAFLGDVLRSLSGHVALTNRLSEIVWQRYPETLLGQPHVGLNAFQEGFEIPAAYGCGQI